MYQSGIDIFTYTTTSQSAQAMHCASSIAEQENSRAHENAVCEHVCVACAHMCMCECVVCACICGVCAYVHV